MCYPNSHRALLKSEAIVRIVVEGLAALGPGYSSRAPAALLCRHGAFSLLSMHSYNITCAPSEFSSVASWHCLRTRCHFPQIVLVYFAQFSPPPPHSGLPLANSVLLFRSTECSSRATSNPVFLLMRFCMTVQPCL